MNDKKNRVLSFLKKAGFALLIVFSICIMALVLWINFGH
jgi:hypothetical protein